MAASSEFPSLEEFVMEASVLSWTEAEQLCRTLSKLPSTPPLLRTLQLDFLHCYFNLDNKPSFGSHGKLTTRLLTDRETVPSVFRALSMVPAFDSFQHTTLESSNLTRSRLADAEANASILFPMLPHIERDSWDFEIYFVKQWDEVNSYLDLLNGSPESEETD
ncbi:uncharacterized protein F5147DRAFT_767480 [Suillus discolor]|uniref:Uncharacterized protein n=1 Tax=Suillus discolor TaxID=1912936 RepID=A0A9P7FK60_9AGAM|nr:uncharacterized protein F5147DRAFT_767480 [Suillus discolor]KAG2118715.1 hypothetical protein F5147DRAFT_767480 [Suillus discolor]